MADRRRKAAQLRRVVVLGGFFAGVIAGVLRHDGVVALRPARGQVNVERDASLRSYLRSDDVVVDAAGPFQSRSTALLEVAMAVGADVIDINESLAYARKVAALRERIAGSGIAVFTACSAVSTVAAALVRRADIERPVRVSALVAPASRETAHEGTLRSLLASVGAPIEVWRAGRFKEMRGWRESRRFELALRRGYLVESVLALDLPLLWPTLRDVDTWTDTSTPGANAMLSVVARAPALRPLAAASIPLGAALARTLGTRRGGFAIEVADDAVTRAFWLHAERGSYRIAALPAALAAQRLATERGTVRGIVPTDEHVSVDALFMRLRESGIELTSA